MTELFSSKWPLYMLFVMNILLLGILIALLLMFKKSQSETLTSIDSSIKNIEVKINSWEEIPE